MKQQNEKHHKRTSFRRIPSSHNPMESSKRGYRVDTMLVISFTSRLRTAIVSFIIVFGHATAHAMHTCKSERAHPSAIIFLDNNIANNDIVMMMTMVMITKRNERMEPKSQNLSITYILYFLLTKNGQGKYDVTYLKYTFFQQLFVQVVEPTTKLEMFFTKTLLQTNMKR